MASTARSPALDAGAGAVQNSAKGVTEETKETGLGRRAVETGSSAVENLQNKGGMSHAAIMQTVRVLGGAMIGIAILVVVLSEVFALDAIANDTGEFSGIIDSLTSTGNAAIGLLVIGLLVLAANQVMGFFGGGGF